MTKKEYEQIVWERNYVEKMKCFYYLQIQREVKYLVHFTPVGNLDSIKEHGIVPLCLQEENGICSERTDEYRFDGSLYNNFTISFPNYKMMYKKKLEGKHLAVLLIDVDVLKDKEIMDHVCYHSTNAASGRSVCGCGFVCLQRMFASVVNYKGREIRRDFLDIPGNFTTDPQAEIDIGAVIPSKYIKEVIVDPSDDEACRVAKNSGFSDIVRENREMFLPRTDFNAWNDHIYRQYNEWGA